MGDDTRIIFGSGAAIQLPDGVTIEDVIEAAARLQQRKSDVSVSEEISPRVAEGSGNVRPAASSGCFVSEETPPPKRKPLPRGAEEA